MMSIKTACLQICVIGLLATIASAGHCSDRTKNSANSKFQAQYTNVFNGDKLVFAVIGDWGRIGGEDSDGTLANCKARAAAYLANNNVQYGDDSEGNACGGLQQVQTAILMDAVCADKGCQFVVNTGDNFYINGCFGNDNPNVPDYLKCKARFQNDWENIYNSPSTPNIRGLPWINSLGNHDVLGNISGIRDQIAYQGENPNWILPQRYYAADVSARHGASIRFHVAHTSCFVKGYRQNTSDYYHTDELQACSTEQAVADQVKFLNESFATSTADFDVILAHHPAFSTAGPSYFQTNQVTPSADGWQPLRNFTKDNQPVAYFNGHDHAMSYQYLDAPVTNDTGDGTTITSGYPYTGFHTSGAGSWAQAGDGGYGLPQQYSFSKYTNTDLDRGVARGGFLIVTVQDCNFTVEYYSAESGKDVPFMVTTQAGGKPMTKLSPYAIKNDILMNSNGASVAFRKLLREN